MTNLAIKARDLPQASGVYQFLDKNGRILYIGKAKNLRARVGQYFAKGDGRPQIPFLMKETAGLDYTVVNTELESLYLERTLIQKHHPKYNIELKDDKSYVFIVIDYSTEIPQIIIRRRPNGNNSKIQNSNDKSSPKTPYLKPDIYFGPYTSAKKIRDLIFMMRKIFGLCSAKKSAGKPCFYHYLHRCPGVCAGIMSLKDYYDHLNKIKQFLSGKITPVIKKIKKDMRIAARQKKFEAAARLRDQLRAIEMLTAKQNVIMAKPVDWDIIALAEDGNVACVNLFKIRGGKLGGKENFIFETSAYITHGRELYKHEQKEVLQNFLETYYPETSDAPKAIFLPDDVDNAALIKTLIKSRFSQTIKIDTPKKGRAATLVKLGSVNAQEYLKNYLSEKAGHLDKVQKGLQELKAILKLPSIPRRIEGYDISNLQGTNPVGSMVVFADGLPAKSQYRKFKIRTKDTPDDFTMMREMIVRRLAHAPALPSPIGGGKKGGGWTLPDLMVIDGGKGQLSVASALIHNSKFIIPVVGLAKRIEEIFLPHHKWPILLPRDNPALQLLQRLRDEAHRFGLSFHRNLRSKQAIKSALDGILGIGPKTKKLLKQRFGTVTNIREAPLDELAKAIGKKLAKAIKQQL